MSCIVLLVIFGLIMLASASSNLGKTKFNDTYYYVTHQMLYGASLGVIGFLLGYFIYYQSYRKFAFIFLIISLGILALVFTPLGIQAKGAARWIAIGPVSF